MTDIDKKLGKNLGSDHTDNRSMQDRGVSENRELMDAERAALFRARQFQSALPDLPDIPGFHVCWLTTTNPRDSIPTRMRLGYEPIRPEDIPGYEVPTIKTGELNGMIGVNEMVAFKLPIDLYQMYMRIAHHEEPMREESKLADTAQHIAEQARKQGADVIEGDGIEALRKSVRAPMSF